MMMSKTFFIRTLDYNSKLINFLIFIKQILHKISNIEYFSACFLNKFFTRKHTSILVHALPQPVVQRFQISLPEGLSQIGYCLAGRGKQLGCKKAAKTICRKIPKTSMTPVNV